jgi:hypothetical protein
MLKQTLTATTKPLDDLMGFLDSYREVAAEEYTAAVSEVSPAALSELRSSPKRRQWPGDYPAGKLEWESEAQRRYYWAVIAKFDSAGRHIPYKRTNAIPNAWEFYSEASGGDIRVVIVNRSPKAKYVYGSLSLRNAGKFQQKFHAITGWFEGAAEVNFWLDAVEEQYLINIGKRLGDLAGTVTSRRRAFTGK